MEEEGGLVGVEYTIVNHKNKTLFDMGKTYIRGWNEDKLWLYERSWLLEVICEQYASNENFKVGYCVWLRDQLWNFVQGVQKEEEIEILSDSGHGDQLYEMEHGKWDWHNNKQLAEPEYTVAGSRYCKQEVWMQWILDNY